MTRTDTRPAWAEPVPDTDPDGKIVRCGCCGRDMSWRRFLDHGPECDGPAEREVAS